MRNKTRCREGLVFSRQILEPLRAMLDAFEARLKPNQTLEERIRAYLDPQLETKWLEIFQKMIEGTQALLQRQMEMNKPFEGHETQPYRSEQVPSRQENLIPSNETKMESPQQSKSHRRRTKTFK